ncbi:hypothetical protein [Colwellia sp. TT2012]|uniref:hypothetical protein n=1 Tax=Colwellia sp. TT2012 TaxID=1720342 RepID=UPI000A8B9CA7|nr:hypothetical protein [Colwellia sp. TT2012]
MKNSLIIITLLSFFCYCPTSNAQKKIYWFSDNTKEYIQSIKTSSVPSSMVIDTTRLLLASLPQYQFNLEFAQSPSIARLLKKLPNSCAPNRIKTPERLKDNIYSSPLNIALNLRLYYKKREASSILPKNALDNNKRLKSLAALFTGKSTYTLGIDEGRSLGGFLDKQIATLEQHNLIIRSGGEATTSLVKMLLKERIDYIVDYPVSVNKALKHLPTALPLASVEIAGSPGYIVGYVACHKGPLGQQVIKDINQSLQKLYLSYPFYQAHTRYLASNDVVNFNQAYQAVFKVKIPLKNDP